ncbi:hypothetical protein DGG96_14815 [Legionella qingyii]|uniref:Uncharacterized protein n=1 Tax=Legionella qingyii TaxID=2184757 RepID=A0A317U252_9GAMM|nr:hypothetical protein [Legionella qingyii]PWY54887.1 hypothetical protein DGG96_14815 [Legionella qingyii]RUR20910.1 hypothetical protein ELY20_13975 [Legionella qingyii]RUR23241.1 hypothetical protein ELY16_13690 [Legionella qingyii]
MKAKQFFSHVRQPRKGEYSYSNVVLDYLNTRQSSILKDFKAVYKTNLHSRHDTFPNFVAHLEKNNKKNLIFRGMSNNEVADFLKMKKFLCAPSKKKQDHYNIPEHVILNNTTRFGSFTPSLQVGGTYASMSTIVPSTGAIVTTNLPPFFVNPKEILGTHEELYKRYKKRYDLETEMHTEFQGLTDVLETAAKNIEITMIRNFGKKYVGLGIHDVKQIHLLTVPGQLLCNWTSIKTPLHEVSFENPGYKLRVCSVKVGFAEHDAYLADEFELVNQRNRDMGLIPPDGRVITMHEAKYLAKSGILEILNSMYENDDETYVFSHVPSNIPVNDMDAIRDHMMKTIEALPYMRKIGPKIEEITDEEPQKEGPELG